MEQYSFALATIEVAKKTLQNTNVEDIHLNIEYIDQIYVPK